MLPRFLTKKKIASLFILCSLFLILVARPILAYSTPNSTYQFQFENAVFKTDEMNLQSFVYEVMKAVAAAGVTLGPGCFTCDKDERENNPGMLAGATSLIAGIYASPPASGVQYVAHIGNKLGIAQPVYAQGQGMGFEQMRPVMSVWQAFRDLSYGLFIIIFIFIGFAIMFRVKISPQAVITIESALPKMIIALLIVTFSYAIVGFMIDIAYVLCFLITSIFRDIPLTESGSYGDLIDQWSGSVGRTFGSTTQLMIETLYTDLVFFIFLPIISLFLVILRFPGIGLLLAIFAVIIGLIAILRCLWTLLKTYAMIIIGLIFSPLQILIGTLPGSDAISSWFKNMLANIAVLPTMTVMFFLSSYLMFKGVEQLVGTNLMDFVLTIMGLVPGSAADIPGDLLGAIADFFIPQNPFEYIQGIILATTGVMVLWMAPKASDMIKSFITEKPFEFGTALGESITKPLGYGMQAIDFGTKLSGRWQERRAKSGATGGGTEGGSGLDKWGGGPDAQQR